MALQTLEECLESMDYPGRVEIVGVLPKPDNKLIVIYCLTGRSPSSQARKLVEGEEGAVKVEVTDEEQLKKGNPALLVYRPIIPHKKHIAFGNGTHTELIYNKILGQYAKNKSHNSGRILRKALKKGKNFVYDKESNDHIDLSAAEPDKYHTPRIAGCLQGSQGSEVLLGNFTMYIVRQKEDSEKQKSKIYYHLVISVEQGHGRLFATYTGENKEPLPVWKGRPTKVNLNETDIEKITAQVWNSLNPDYRVSVAAMALNPQTSERELRIINRHDKAA